MAGEWPKATIAEVAERVAMGPFGSSIKVSTFVEQGIPVISGQHLRGSRLEDNKFNFVSEAHADSLKNANVFQGDVVFTHAGNIGQCAYIPETSKFSRYVLSQRQFYVRCNKSKVLPEFITCFFKSAAGRHALLANASQTGVPSIARPVTYVRTIEIPLPPLPEQRSITSILGNLDDLIELNRETNEILEEMARALFKSWFVDFDPVRAKLEGRPPAGMDAATAALFPDHFQDSELGQIPKGWSVGKFGDVCASSRQGVSPEQIDPDTPYIGLEHMPRRSIALGEWETAAKVSSGKSAFNKGDILFGKLRPYFHKVGVAPVNGVCSTDILVLLPKKPDWFGFVLGHASSDALVQFADQSSAGTKMPRTNWKDMSSFQITIPPQNVASAFSQIVRSQVETIQESIFESRDLATLRDTLLPKLLSGEVSAPGAEELIAAST